MAKLGVYCKNKLGYAFQNGGAYIPGSIGTVLVGTESHRINIEQYSHTF